MQHDLFHAYTVDQHILLVIRNLRHFTASAHAHEYPLCTQIMANFAQPWLLYIAALFHDIAKGCGGDHAHLGSIEARHFCQQHNLNYEQIELVTFLVEHHLTLSQTAQKKDLSSAEVIHQFVQIVRTERRLNALYLLTIADIRATSPQILTPWKAKLLEDLYRLSMQALKGNLLSTEQQLTQRQQQALHDLQQQKLPKEAYQNLWRVLNIGYFLRHDANEIVWQTSLLWNQVNTARPLIKGRLGQINETLQITVYTKDQPELFMRICAYFTQHRLNILDAKIHTTQHHYALDTFIIMPAQLRSEHPAAEKKRLLVQIERDLTLNLEQLSPFKLPTRRRLSRRSRVFPITPIIECRPDDLGRYYLLEITANDQHGLLFLIAQILAKYHINLHTAKIATLDERVEDVFLVEGEILREARKQIQFESELFEVLRIK